jgi:hypothetical protein
VAIASRLGFGVTSLFLILILFPVSTAIDPAAAATAIAAAAAANVSIINSAAKLLLQHLMQQQQSFLQWHHLIL